MSKLTLTVRAEAKLGPYRRVNLYGITPDRLRGLSVAEIERLPLQVEHAELPLSEVLSVIEGERDQLILDGDLTAADYVGGGMREGQLMVRSDVGDYLAEKLRGGHVQIFGAARDYACSAQLGGFVEITGNVGYGCAAAREGARGGMRGGWLKVAGDAGDRLAARMRRGTVIVMGQVAGDVATWMVAGTLVLHGQIVGTLGVGMRRGTILWLADHPPPRHAGFTGAEQVELSYLTLLMRSLDDASRRRLEELQSVEAGASLYVMNRSLGDRAAGGLGELLWYSRLAVESPAPI